MDEDEIAPRRLMDTELSGFIIAFYDASDTGTGNGEQARYEDAVNRLSSLPPEKLIEYGEILDEIVAWEESKGFFGEYTLGEARTDFNSVFGHLIMNSEYGAVKLEGCSGFP